MWLSHAFPRHAEVYAPPDNWRGTKARKEEEEPDHNRDTVHGVELQEGGETTRRRKSPASPETEDTWLRRVASQTGTANRQATGGTHYRESGFRKKEGWSEAPSRQHHQRRETHGSHTVRREMGVELVSSTVESQQLLRPLSHAQRAPDGTAPVGKFTAPWQVSTG